MKFINFLLLLLCIFEVNVMAAKTRPSVGFFPISFPRDPVDVNVYLEHILLGQVIEPLVESGTDGKMVPAVASGWEFSQNGTVLRFFLKNEILFSTGKRVTAEDVKYSLERHLNSNNSQSKPYLKRIKKIEIKSPEEIVLHLDGPYVAMLKALSRDHLGILPAGWKFSAAATEPFIGTGAYRAIRENDRWTLRKNPHFRNAATVSIPEWDVVFQKNVAQAFDVPTLVPFAYDATVKEMKKSPEWSKGEVVEEPVVHFFQSSAWWYPGGTTFTDSKRQLVAMCATERYISLRVKKLNLHRATGLIPEGIAGHLAQKPEVTCEPKKVDLKSRDFTVVALSRERMVLEDPEIKKQVEDEFGIKLKLLSLELHAPESALTELKPDVFVLGFAGGFHDPEGFLTVISSMLCSNQKEIFQSDYPNYLAASADSNWDSRTTKYQAINQNLITNLRMVPGWKVPVELVRNKNIMSNRNDLRYTAKLRDYKLGKEQP